MQDITLSLNFSTHLNNVGQLIHVIDKFDKIYLLIAMLSYIYIYIQCNKSIQEIDIGQVIKCKWSWLWLNVTHVQLHFNMLNEKTQF